MKDVVAPRGQLRVPGKQGREVWMQVRAVLKAIDRTAPDDPRATVQLIGLGCLNTFQDGYALSKALPLGLLVPGADVVVQIADPYRPGDGEIVAISGVTSQDQDGAGPLVVQAGDTLMTLDEGGDGTATVIFPVAYLSVPRVTVGAPLGLIGYGTVRAVSVSTGGFTAQISGAMVAGGIIPVSWSAMG